MHTTAPESSDGRFVSYVNSQEFAVSGCRNVSEVDHLLALFPIDHPRVLHLLFFFDGIEGSCIDRVDGEEDAHFVLNELHQHLSLPSPIHYAIQVAERCYRVKLALAAAAESSMQVEFDMPELFD